MQRLAAGAEKRRWWRRFSNRPGWCQSPPPGRADGERSTQVVAAAGDRIKMAGDILDFADFFLPDDRLPYDEKAFDKHFARATRPQLLAKFRDRLAAAEPFDVPTLEATDARVRRRPSRSRSARSSIPSAWR